MKRYLLFMGLQHYPKGGWQDFKDSYDSLEEAISAVANYSGIEWWHVVDTEEQRVVSGGQRS